MILDDVLRGVGAVLMVLGALLGLTAAIGLLRLPDVLSRMHAATKPQVLGLVLVVLGAALNLRTSVDAWMLVLTGAFTVLTAPVTAHLVGRLAHRTGEVRRDLLHRDELTEPDDPEDTDAAEDTGPEDADPEDADGPDGPDGPAGRDGPREATSGGHLDSPG